MEFARSTLTIPISRASPSLRAWNLACIFLSYSTFEYSGLRANRTAKGAQISVRVKNTSAREGDEVVQLYVSGALPKGQVQIGVGGGQPIGQIPHVVATL